MSDTTGNDQYFAPRTTNDPGNFAPFEGEFWEMGFEIPTASRASLYVLPGGSDRALTAFDDLALGAGEYTYYWAGLTTDGEIAGNVNYLWSVNAWTLPNNSVVVRSIPEVRNVVISPTQFSPTDKFPADPTLSIDFETDVRSSVQVKLVRIDNGLTLRSWSTGFVEAGEKSIPWDGRSTSDSFVSPGEYYVSFLSVDEAGNVSIERRAVLQVLY